MEPYSNDYTPEEDIALWQLHEIRHEIAEQDESPEQINAIGRRVISQYKLKNLRIIQVGNR